jgi:hypothetical protein
MMIEINKISEWICRYNEGDLHGDELKTFKQMVSSDRELQREVLLDRKMNQFLNDSDLLEFRKAMIWARKSYAHQAKYQVLTIAASLLVLVTTCTIFLFVSMPGPVRHAIAFSSPGHGDGRNLTGEAGAPSTTPIRHGPVRTRDHNAGIAGTSLAYIPLARMERLCGESVRAEFLSVISPEADKQYHRSETIRFEWRTGAESEISIEIINNKGKVVAGLEAEKSTWREFKAGSLSPGLYYWKLIDHENLVYTGKFRIK